MPIFEFRCDECGKSFEKIVLKANSTENDICCPNCGSKKCTKLISAIGAVGSSSSRDTQSASSCSTGCCSCSLNSD